MPPYCAEDNSSGSRAGLWQAWEEPEGPPSPSFTMLTVNANEHLLMKRFRKPGDEKRSVVIVPAVVYEDWLGCRNTDEERSFLSLYPADEMVAEAYPLPPRKTKVEPTDGAMPMF